MGCAGSSQAGPAIKEPGVGRRKSYNTGGNVFPRSARASRAEPSTALQQVAAVMYISKHNGLLGWQMAARQQPVGPVKANHGGFLTVEQIEF